MIKSKEIGTVDSSSGKLVLMSQEEINRLCDDHGLDAKQVLEDYDNVVINFGYENTFGVDAVKVLQTDGQVYSATTIGIQPDQFVRLLNNHEKSFQEFVTSRMTESLQPGTPSWDKAAKDYHNYINGVVDGEVRPNADLDNIFARGL
jgi:hypothetical protein